jgi:hypothetical protein
MRQPPAEFTKGPKPTREKLNALVKAVRENVLHPGLGLRVRETDRGFLLTLDDKILRVAGLANSEQLGRGADNGGRPFGGGDGLNDFNPPSSDPTPPNPNPEPPLPPGVDGTVPDDPTTEDGFPPLMWATFDLPDGELDETYSASLFAIGGNGTYSYSVTGGSLPPGLSLSGNEIGGTITSLGSYSFDVTVTSGEQSKPASFSVTVNATGGIKIVGSSYMGSAFWLDRTSIMTTLSVVGGTPPYAVFVGGNGSLLQWFNAGFVGGNATRPPSLSFFSPSQIYAAGVQVKIIANFELQNRAGLVPQGWDVTEYRLARATPIGPRRVTLYAFDTNGLSTSKTVTVDFLWDTSRYTAVKTGPGSGFDYPRWIDKSSYDANPSAYTLLPSNEIPRVT